MRQSVRTSSVLTFLILLGSVGATACGQSVDPAGIPSVANACTTWVHLRPMVARVVAIDAKAGAGDLAGAGLDKAALSADIERLGPIPEFGSPGASRRADHFVSASMGGGRGNQSSSTGLTRSLWLG